MRSFLGFGKEHTSWKHGIFSESIAKPVPHFQQAPMLDLGRERQRALPPRLKPCPSHPNQAERAPRPRAFQKPPGLSGEDAGVIGGDV